MVPVNGCTSKSPLYFLGHVVWGIRTVHCIVFSEHDFLGVSRNDSIPSAVLPPMSLVAPVSDEPFFEDVQFTPEKQL